MVIDLVTPAAVAAAAAGGFVLDGFPRTTPQALAAADLGLRLGIRFQAVVYLDVPEDELTARLLRRATKQGRTDDTPEVIRHRLHVFAKETQPLTECYRSRGNPAFRRRQPIGRSGDRRDCRRARQDGGHRA